jgi:hypothetical protein
LNNVIAQNISPLHNEKKVANRLLAMLRQLQAQHDGRSSAAQLAAAQRLKAQQIYEQAERLRREAESARIVFANE